MTRCCVLPLFFLFIYFQVSQKWHCCCLVQWRGTDGKALLQPLAFVGRLCGMQMCLGEKGWVLGLALKYHF